MGSPLRWIVVEGDEAVTAEQVQYRGECGRVGGQRGEFRAFDAPPRIGERTPVGGCVPGFDQVQKDLLRQNLGFFCESVVKDVDPLHERTGQSTDVAVGGQRQRVCRAAVEKFRERVLQQRQRTGRLSAVGDKCRYQGRFDVELGVARRSDDHVVQFFWGSVAG